MKNIFKKILAVFTFILVFVSNSFAAEEVRHPFEVYSGSFGPKVFGFSLGERFDAEAIYHRFQDEIDTRGDNSVVVKLVYDFYTSDGESHVKFTANRFSFANGNNFVLLERTKSDFSEAKGFDPSLKSSMEDIGSIPDNRLARMMRNQGYEDQVKSVSLKRKEDDKTMIAIITNDSGRIDMIRINGDKKEIEEKKISYESIVKQALEMFNLEGFEKQVDNWGNDYYVDNRIGYKVKFYKSENGDINTVLSLAPIK